MSDNSILDTIYTADNTNTNNTTSDWNIADDTIPESYIENLVGPAPFSNNFINLINNPQDLFNKEPLPIPEIKDIKDKVLDILLKKSDFNDDEYNEENYKDKEIDEICQRITNIKNDFNKVQKELVAADTKLSEEIKNMNSIIYKLDTFTSFLQTIGTIINPEDTKELTDKIKDISKKVAQTDSFIQAKKNYAIKRKELQKFIYFFRKINKWNETNMCVICLDNPVEYFFDPCGHTYCLECTKTILKINTKEEINRFATIVNELIICPLCKGTVISSKPLYFL
tara:strand:+ start:1481 stop:2329 length:849 start_codon:yes stop_codon:yes gene_type:complete